MTTKEKITLSTNLAIAAAITAFVCLGKVPWLVGLAIMIAVLTPSSAPAVLAAIRDAVAEKKPPHGPSIFGLVLAIVSALHFVTGCGAGKEPAPETARPCVSLKVDVDECGVIYESALTACATAATTRGQSEACEDGLRKEFGRPPRAARLSAEDGGAP